MGKFIKARIWLTTAKLVAILGVAIFVLGLNDLTKMRLVLGKEKQDVIVEIHHKPMKDNRQIFITGESSLYSTRSYIQVDGENCAVIHRLKWRGVPPVGVLTVEVRLVDVNGKQVDWTLKNLIMGPDEGSN